MYNTWKKKTNLHNWLNKPKEYSEVNSKDIYDDGEGTCFYLFIVFNFLGQWCLKVIRKRLPKHSFHWCGNASKGPTLAHSIVKKKKKKKKRKERFQTCSHCSAKLEAHFIRWVWVWISTGVAFCIFACLHFFGWVLYTVYETCKYRKM